MQKVIKRNGKKVKFEPTKISNAVEKAFIEVDNELTSYGKRKAIEIATDISKIETLKYMRNEERLANGTLK